MRYEDLAHAAFAMPFASLPVREVISSVHLIADLTLNLGEVVHGYLSPGHLRV